MEPTGKTIAFLRTLTLDGYLTSEEVWALGKFFNDNHDCTKTWPGEVLAPMISSAFDDTTIDEEEMTLLAETISSIESEWLMRNPGLAQSAECAEPFSTHPALVPLIDARFDVPSSRENDSYVVALKGPMCTCPDWQTRRSLPEHNLGRCCKHIAYAFTRSGKVFEPWFQAVLDNCFAFGRGTNATGDSMLVQIPGQKPSLISVGPKSWCNVLAPTEEGYQTFAFNTEDGRWSYGEAPTKAGAIEKAIREHFSPAQAQA